jgi:hypothetical protein
MTKLRDSRWFILLEMALVAGVFVADAHHHIYLSKTPYLIALGWISLSMRGQRWRAVGLSIPRLRTQPARADYCARSYRYHRFAYHIFWPLPRHALMGLR